MSQFTSQAGLGELGHRTNKVFMPLESVGEMKFTARAVMLPLIRDLTGRIDPVLVPLAVLQYDG